MAEQSVPAGGVAALEIHTTGRRVLATIVDGVVIAVVAMLVGALFGTTRASSGEVSTSLSGLSSLLAIALAFGYYIALEGTRGQTLGKMLFGIKVVDERTGEPPGMGAATIRTLLRVVDGLFGYLIGFVVVLVSAKRQRLGDMAAKTLVVRNS